MYITSVSQSDIYINCKEVHNMYVLYYQLSLYFAGNGNYVVAIGGSGKYLGESFGKNLKY